MTKAKKYYAVRKGRNPGIYTSWDEAKKQVEGYPGAQYKSFLEEEAALDFLFVPQNILSKSETKPVKESGLSKLEDELDPKKINKEISNFLASLEDKEAAAFVDGSFFDGRSGSGIFYKDADVEMKISMQSEDWDGNRNVHGEIEAAKSAILIARNRGNKKLTLFYDYEGICRWATGEWRTNKESTKEYASFVKREISAGISLEFIHINAHTGVFYNELADALAKSAIGLK